MVNSNDMSSLLLILKRSSSFCRNKPAREREQILSDDTNRFMSDSTSVGVLNLEIKINIVSFDIFILAVHFN